MKQCKISNTRLVVTAGDCEVCACVNVFTKPLTNQQTQITDAAGKIYGIQLQSEFSIATVQAEQIPP